LNKLAKSLTMSPNSFHSIRIPRFCIVFLLLMVFMISQSQNEQLLNLDTQDRVNNILVSPKSKLSAYISSDPIIISGNSDFATKAGIYGWSGDGNSSNPYIIENLQIINNTNSSAGISITGVSIYFIIQNNYIEMTGISSNGIELSSTSNVATIQDNIFNNNTGHGVYLYNSDNITILHNNFTNNKGSGFHTWFGTQTKILNNTFYKNDDGLYLRSTSNNILMHNNISSNTVGIFHSGGNTYNTYYNNTFKDNVNYHIHTQPDYEYNNITYNVFDNSSSNIYFSGTVNHNLIYNNNFTNNGGGIRFTVNPSNNSVYNNRFLNNAYGVWSDIGTGKIYNNIFIGNGYAIDIIFYHMQVQLNNYHHQRVQYRQDHFPQYNS